MLTDSAKERVQQVDHSPAGKDTKGFEQQSNEKMFNFKHRKSQHSKKKNLETIGVYNFYQIVSQIFEAFCKNILFVTKLIQQK